MDFINECNILNSNQIGFIPDHNTPDALLEFLDNAYEVMNKNKLFLAFFLDFFFKAFYTFDYEIILRKLDFYGFMCESLHWLSFFLNNRTQFVEVGN